ncbi:MAG TPA: flagellar hook-length control protein FliK [Gammaproteobacteria bacterium]|nr:flagellar hook-length control protein FliK [Gammaproteobacteria bacterium]
METRQLANINLNSSQLKASKSTILAETSGSKQQNSFEAGLNKQIRELRESRSKEDKNTQVKNDRNQRDSASRSGANVREKNASKLQKDQEPDKKEAEAVQKSVLDKNDSVRKAGSVDEPLAAGELLTAEDGEDLSLPLTGIALPLSKEDFLGQESASVAELSEGELSRGELPGGELFGDVEENIMSTELSAQIRLATESLSSGSNQNSYQAAAQISIQASGAGEAVESSRPAKQAVVLPPVQTALNQTDKTSMQFFQPEQATKIPDEMPVVDLIAQTTRLLQVPVTTTLSKGMFEGVGPESSIQQGALQTLTAGVAAPVSNSSVNSVTSAIGVNLASPDWSDQMTQKVSMMLQGGIQKAEIKLNPAHLGPMEIKLSMSDDRASVSFVAQHAPVRDAIEQAMPRLREMLEEQGLNLVDVDVSTQSERYSEQQSDQQSGEADTKQQGADSMQSVDNLQKDNSLGRTDIIIDRTVNIYA